ncbi:MAG: SDR family NAD(P)-dependent oxidoreductase [Pseudomonadota bacterium]
MSEPLPKTPSFRLTGRRALITGAGRGIGRACAAALADAGAEVVLVARTHGEVEQVADDIRSQGGKAQAHKLDVTDVGAVIAFMEAQEPFEILVNNAGTNRPKSIFDVEAEDYDAVFQLNVRSLVLLTRQCAIRLRDAGKAGSFIHIGSQMGHVGGPERTLYCASKWAVEGFNKALALDLAPYGIRTNTIAPTFIETPLTRPYFEDAAFREGVLHKIKLGRLGQVEDIMGAVVYLASNASSLVTGTSLIVDGGWTAD